MLSQLDALQQLVHPAATDHWSGAPHCPAAFPPVQRSGFDVVQELEEHCSAEQSVEQGR